MRSFKSGCWFPWQLGSVIHKSLFPLLRDLFCLCFKEVLSSIFPNVWTIITVLCWWDFYDGFRREVRRSSNLVETLLKMMGAFWTLFEIGYNERILRFCMRGFQLSVLGPKKNERMVLIRCVEIYIYIYIYLIFKNENNRKFYIKFKSTKKIMNLF